MAKTKKIYRSEKERMIGGVAGGIADYLNTDPTIIRLIWVLITILSVGAGLVGYLIAWIIIPEK